MKNTIFFSGANIAESSPIAIKSKLGIAIILI